MLIRQLVGDDLGAKIQPIWHLDDEGEMRGVYRDLDAAPNMWPILGMYLSIKSLCCGAMSDAQCLVSGNLAWCRFFSKHLALREYIHHVHRRMELLKQLDRNQSQARGSVRHSLCSEIPEGSCCCYSAPLVRPRLPTGRIRSVSSCPPLLRHWIIVGEQPTPCHLIVARETLCSLCYEAKLRLTFLYPSLTTHAAQGYYDGWYNSTVPLASLRYRRHSPSESLLPFSRIFPPCLS